VPPERGAFLSVAVVFPRLLFPARFTILGLVRLIGFPGKERASLPTGFATTTPGLGACFFLLWG